MFYEGYGGWKKKKTVFLFFLIMNSASRKSLVSDYKSNLFFSKYKFLGSFSLDSQLESTQTDEMASVTINIINIPNNRYMRNVVFTSLDLVVSIGGIAGLFFGASVLSIVEIIYIIFLRRFY